MKINNKNNKIQVRIITLEVYHTNRCNDVPHQVEAVRQTKVTDFQHRMYPVQTVSFKEKDRHENTQ